MSEEKLCSRTYGIRLKAETDKRLDALVEAVPVATRHSMAREAVRLGLKELECEFGRNRAKTWTLTEFWK